MSDLPFADAVATRASVDVERAVEVLDKYRVTAAPQPPVARQLRVRRIRFSGTKMLTETGPTPFAFDWEVDSAGLWMLASGDNLVGKSTVLQVALWALRGRPKYLTATARGWIESVAVSFLAGGKAIEVAFSNSDGAVSGTVTLTTGGKPEMLRFENEGQFARVMQDVMLEALALEPVPASRATASGRVESHDDGWLAYTGAFLSDSRSNAIIGEATPGTDLTQRLLQVYLGLPWVTTLFQARAKAKQVAAEGELRRKRFPALGGRSLDELEEQLAVVRRQISDEALRSTAAKLLVEAQAEFDRHLEGLRRARTARDDAEEEARGAEALSVMAQRTVNALREDHEAARFIRRLAPTCCPRCDKPISQARLEAEVSERRCSICTEGLPERPDEEANAIIAEAADRAEQLKAGVRDTRKAAKAKASEFEQAQAWLDDAGLRLQAATGLGTAADLQVLTRQEARLEGVLEVARTLAASDGVSQEEVRVLEAAEQEASRRVQAAADRVLDAVSDEMKRIVTKLGMGDVGSIRLKRNAHVDVEQSGKVIGWKDIASGEQLRLRLAAVVALVRCAAREGFGRHPGLLLIDSPGNEEMNKGRVSDFLAEVAALVGETPEVQVIIAMEGIEKAEGVVPPERLKTPSQGKYMW